MPKVATWLFVGLALLVLIVGMAMATNICPFGDDPQEMLPPITTGGAVSTVGVCEGVVGANHYTGYHQTSEGVTGQASVAGSLLSVGGTQYARQTEFHASDMGLTFDGVSALDVVGRAAFQDSAYNEVMAPTDGDFVNTTPACVRAYNEVGGVLTQGMVGTQVGMTNNPSTMSLQMQTAVGPSELMQGTVASGSFYTRSSIHTMVGDSTMLTPTLGMESAMQDSSMWRGNFQVLHQFQYSVSNLGSLTRDLSETQ